MSTLSTTSLKNQINVTPLADVMLVLLIIFMVVTPLLNTGVDVNVPEAAHPAEHPDNDETLVLSMREDGSFFLNRDSVAREELEARLSSILERRAEKILFVKAAEVLDYGEVLQVMDLCRRAGAEEVALITREKES